MPTHFAILTTTFLLILANNLTSAQDQAVYSGPQVGEKLPPLKVSLAYRQDSGTTVDFVELAAGRPALLVIVNGANRPAANLTRCLMNFAELQEMKLFAGIVYLDSDRSAAEQYLQRATSWWGVGLPVGVSVDGAEGPGSYGLNRNVNLTVLVADKGRVTANFALIQPSLTDAPKILEKVVDRVGGRVPGEAEINFLGIPTQKPANAPYQIAPADVRMRQLICDVLAAADPAGAQSAATALNEYVGEDKSRQAVLGNTAAALLNGRGRAEVTGIPAVEHLRKWRQKYEPPDKNKAGKS